MKAERRLTQDLLGTVLCQSELDLRWQMEEWDHALSTLDMHMQDVVSWAASCRLVCYGMLKSTLLLHVEIQFVTACWNPVCYVLLVEIQFVMYCMLKSSLLCTAG